jgi:hypothetical protein
MKQANSSRTIGASRLETRISILPDQSFDATFAHSLADSFDQMNHPEPHGASIRAQVSLNVA